MRSVLAGDFGGTKCRIAIVGADLSVHGATRFETVRERAPFLRRLEEAVEEALGARPDRLEAPRALGIGTAGIVVPGRGALAGAPNLPLEGYPLADDLTARFGLPTTLINDGRASAWGEYLRGRAAGRDPLLCLFFGTGIGIGLMVGGRPFAGAANAAGQIGHTFFRAGGRRCPCGDDGHYEAYCGGRAITERAAAELGPAADGSWTVGDVVAAAAGDDPCAEAAQAILADAADAACELVANACILLNPAAVVLGGGVLKGWPALYDRIEAHVRRHTSPEVHQGLLLAASLGGSDAVLWGAATATGALSG